MLAQRESTRSNAADGATLYSQLCSVGVVALPSVRAVTGRRQRLGLGPPERNACTSGRGGKGRELCIHVGNGAVVRQHQKGDDESNLASSLRLRVGMNLRLPVHGVFEWIPRAALLPDQLRELRVTHITSSKPSSATNKRVIGAASVQQKQTAVHTSRSYLLLVFVQQSELGFANLLEHLL